jgi:hypothetical protein
MAVQIDNSGRDDQSGRVENLRAIAAFQVAVFAILPSLIPTSDLYGGTKVPSTIVPPLMMVSNSAMTFSFAQAG